MKGGYKVFNMKMAQKLRSDLIRMSHNATERAKETDDDKSSPSFQMGLAEAYAQAAGMMWKYLHVPYIAE